jgi:hypothetical protein
MPFKSKDQMRKFGELVKSGKMSQATFDEWNRATDHANLPERIGPKTNIERKPDYKKRFGL